jgi:transcriptional repressor NrdR
MRCPWCRKANDRVVDSRPVDGGESIRRRRECRSCKRRFTTVERVESLGLTVIKRSGAREAYEREKVVAGVRQAIGNRPVTEEQVSLLVDRVEEHLRRRGPEVSSADVGVEVLRNLAKLDEVAYLRFASVYKDFQRLGDFERELGRLQKRETSGRQTPR